MEFINFIFLFLFHVPVLYFSYNIDLNSPYIKSNFINNKSFFGFSLNIFTSKQNSIKYFLIGAPFDILKDSNETTGALFSCPVTKETQDCKKFVFSEHSNESLLGYVVDSNSHEGLIYTCAPKFLRSHTYVKYVEGACWEFNEMFNEVEQISNQDCLESIKSESQNYEYRNCLTGAALKSLERKQLVLTAPYSYEGKGLLINNNFYSRENSRSSNYLKFRNSNSKYQYTGFSMAVGKIFRNPNVKSIVLGSPGISQYDSTRTQIKFGQVVIGKLIENSLEYVGVIFGEIFGSGYGYSVLAMDLNNDGMDELVVGAPFTNNNNGQVFVYWNIEMSQSNIEHKTIPLDVEKRLLLTSMKKLSNGQYGISLENIGDINKDFIQDLAVGAPFENDGTGAVYIYLGDSHQIIKLSQKIEGQMISPDLRGYGFSIFGKNEDLDSNTYPDFIVGSVLSGHVVGMRTRPIIRVYAENMVAETDMQLPYSFDSLKKCNSNGQEMPCIKLSVSIYYYYPDLTTCPSYASSKTIDYEIELDMPFIKTSSSKRLYFENKLNTVTGGGSINCKTPNSKSNSIINTFNILFPVNLFFNISLPIEITMKWSLNVSEVPKRNLLSDDLADLSNYPVLERVKNNLTNTIHFGVGCSPGSCQPILTMQAVLSLPTEGEQYILHMGNVSKFKLEIQTKNIATTDDNKAFRTYIILTYDAKKINLFSNNPDRKTSTSSGLIYAVNSPLNARQSDNATFECLLPNDFIENVKESIYINISIEAMSPQRHLRPIVLKIKVKMVANIDLKLLVTPDNYQYREDSLLGFSSITGEEKIGPKMKFSIALENNVQNSVILSSKLLIYFPWEISGNPTETDGQYLLYLLRIPKFSITTGNKKIACNVDILNNITNVIKTRIYQDIIPISKLEDVQLKKVTVPTNVPKLPNISDEIKFLPKDSDSGSISEWENIVLIDCFEGSARCVPVVCDLGPLSRQSGEITLQFDIRIWIHTLIENFLKYKFVYIDIPVFWVPLVDYDVVLQVPGGNYKKVRVVAANLQKPKPPASLDVIYAIIIAVSAGVILLATIVIILYKCNFFRRQNVGKRRWK